jgi:hypothetical protein
LKRFAASTVVIIAGVPWFVNNFFHFFQFISRGGKNVLNFQLRDRQRDPAAGFCRQCGCWLYGWETVYVVDGEVICADCLEDYTKERFAQNRWVLEDWNRRDE